MTHICRHNQLSGEIQTPQRDPLQTQLTERFEKCRMDRVIEACVQMPRPPRIVWRIPQQRSTRRLI